MTSLQKKYSQADENKRKLLAYCPLPPETLKSLREYYRVGLTYTSNPLEGNSLTESETKVVIEDGLTIEGKPLRDHYEAVGMHPDYSYEQLATTCGVSRPTIARTVKSLQAYNRIRRIGSDKTGHWVVINKGQP